MHTQHIDGEFKTRTCAQMREQSVIFAGSGNGLHAPVLKYKQFLSEISSKKAQQSIGVMLPTHTSHTSHEVLSVFSVPLLVGWGMFLMMT